MSYKKQQPKLTDKLDVFIDRVEAIHISIQKLEKFNQEMDIRLRLMKQIEIKPNLSGFEQKNHSK